MKVYIISGEASGDLHGANLLRALQQLDPSLQFRGMGGDKLAAAGMQLAHHYGSADYVGFVEVAKNIGTILGMFRKIENDIRQWQPDAILLIDYPGFNLRMAGFAHKLGIRVLYYISPQLWAWKKGRIKTIKSCVERLYCILPFEKEFYRNEGLEVDYVGHPLLDAIHAVQQQPNTLRDDYGLDDRPIIAILPGSRGHEIAHKLPVMLAAAQPLAKDFQLLIAGAPKQKDSVYAQYMQGSSARLIHNRTYDLLRLAHCAMVTSGTATLETAIFDVPQVICYKGNWISFEIAKRLVKVKYVGLANLIMDKLVVKELLQYDMTVENVGAELHQLATDQAYRARIKADYAAMRHLLGDAGASAHAAQLLLARLRSK